MSRRRSSGTEFQILYWRDIPAQVKVRAGRERSSQPLPERFQQAIDRAAMHAGKIDTNGYLEQWNPSEWQSRAGDPLAVAAEIVAELDKEFTDERLREIIKLGGRDSPSVSQFQILFWCDIPAQVKVRRGRERVSRPLPARFEDAVDRAAIEAGKIGNNSYLREWRRSKWEEREGDPETVADTLVRDIDSAYPQERLRELILQCGIEKDS